MTNNGKPSEHPLTDPAMNPRDDPQTQIAPDPEQPSEDED